MKLVSLGVSEKEDRKLVLGAVSKAGYRAKAVEKVKTKEGRKRKTSGSSALPPGNAEETKPSTATASGSSVVSTCQSRRLYTKEGAQAFTLIRSLILLKGPPRLLLRRSGRLLRRMTKTNFFLTKFMSKATRLVAWSSMRYWMRRLALVLLLIWTSQSEISGSTDA